MNLPGPLPKRLLILGMGWSGRVLAAHLQAQGVRVEGTVRDPASAPDDGLQRHQLQADAALSPALLAAIAHTDAVLCSVPPDAEGDPALRLLHAALRDSASLRFGELTLHAHGFCGIGNAALVDPAAVAVAVDRSR